MLSRLSGQSPSRRTPHYRCFSIYWCLGCHTHSAHRQNASFFDRCRSRRSPDSILWNTARSFWTYSVFINTRKIAIIFSHHEEVVPLKKAFLLLLALCLFCSCGIPEEADTSLPPIASKTLTETWSAKVSYSKIFLPPATGPLKPKCWPKIRSGSYAMTSIPIPLPSSPLGS